MRKGTRVYPAHSVLHNYGDTDAGPATIYSGWAVSYRTLEDGRRQVLRILLPGDLIGLGAVIDGYEGSHVEAITDVALCMFPVHTMRALLADDAEIAGRLAAKLYGEVAAGHDHLVNVGARSALERLAWFLLDLFDRLRDLGMVEGDSCAMPLTQQVIADALGLAPANVSRLLRDLREEKLLMLRHHTLTVLDHDRAREMARRFGPQHEGRPLF